MIPFIPAGWQLLAKVVLTLAMIASIYFAVTYTWNKYVAKPYIAEGIAQIQPKLDAANKSIAEKDKAYANLTTQVNQQNEAVSAWKIDSEKRIAGAELATKTARSISISRQGKINALQAQLGKVKTCEAATDIAKGSL